MRVPPRVMSSSGIGVNRGLRWTCGTRGLKRLLKPLMRPKTSILRSTGADDSAGDRGVDGGRIAAGCKDADAFHWRLHLCLARRDNGSFMPYGEV